MLQTWLFEVNEEKLFLMNIIVYFKWLDSIKRWVFCTIVDGRFRSYLWMYYEESHVRPVQKHSIFMIFILFFRGLHVLYMTMVLFWYIGNLSRIVTARLIQIFLYIFISNIWIKMHKWKKKVREPIFGMSFYLIRPQLSQLDSGQFSPQKTVKIDLP